MNDLLLAVDRKQMVGLVLLDLSAAFDTVNHAVILQRLKDRVGVEGTVMKWLESYLENRCQSVVVGGEASKQHKLATGVPQGSVLGPMLFTIYMELGPLGDLIRRHGLEVHFYADDSQLYIYFERAATQTQAKLEACITDLRKWMAQNFLKLNDDKTEFLIISSEQQARGFDPHSVIVGDHNICAVSHTRNIGAIFDQHLAIHAETCQFHLQKCLFSSQ
jgi:hypothetical protein